MMSLIFRAGTILSLTLGIAACATASSGGQGPINNDAGSPPINQTEGIEYSKALLRCHKTGGTRIVKIEGNLRCF